MGDRPIAGSTIEEIATDERLAEREAAFPELTDEQRRAAFEQTEAGRLIKAAIESEEF